MNVSRLVLSAGLFVATALAHADREPAVLYADALDLGDGWYQSPWLGTFQAEADPWIYHPTWEWLYLGTAAEDSLWLYALTANAWLWTGPALVPAVWHDGFGWTHFDDASAQVHAFTTATWLPWDASTLQNYNITAEVARFLDQASIGEPLVTIGDTAANGISAWLDAQLAMPVTLLRPAAETFWTDWSQNLPDDLRPQPIYPQIFRLPWWGHVLTAEDGLRQRVALALSNIFVISDQSATLRRTPIGLADYWDLLQTYAFGNYEELLLAVSLHPTMGSYLSHAGNRKADPDSGRYPDENYAREIMQLFSIGLHQLNPDGTEQRDPSGQPLPTYTNAEITELAKVFTGLHYDWTQDPRLQGRNVTFDLLNRRGYTNFLDPMIMHEEEHEPGPKYLLNGYTIPAGQSGMEDVRDAIAMLAHHPNTGPFISRQLIQRLVTSNPSPAYVARVAAVFADDGEGARGNLGAVVRAILLDPEARSPEARAWPGFGKMREPFLRPLKLFRALGIDDPSGRYWIADQRITDALGQRVFSAPSVFNFFLPTFAPHGVIGDAGLIAPEFQIATAQAIAQRINLWESLIGEGIHPPRVRRLYERSGIALGDVTLDLAPLEAWADDPDVLLDRLDLLLTNGAMTDATRQLLTDNLALLTGYGDYRADRVLLALYLLLLTPDFVLTR